MITTCFFCQNLLSDFIEGILPSSRHEEIKKHLNHCSSCETLHKDLAVSIGILRQLPSLVVKPELSLRIVEASERGKVLWFHRLHFSRATLLYFLPFVLFGGIVLAFPKYFPWISILRGGEDESQFVRYFPLLQGANEILDEQANWLHSREPMMGSLWEEGGLSPEDFEKTFQKKNLPGDTTRGAP